MPERKIEAPAPAQVVTTVQQPSQPHPVALEDSTFRIKDVQVLLAVVVALVIIAGFFMNRAAAKRKEEAEASQKRAEEIKEAIRLSHDDAARDVRELTDKVKDGRTVLEKDLQTLASKIEHERNNRLQEAVAVKGQMDKTNEAILGLRDRMGIQEEKSRNQDHALNELKAILREKIDETKELIKAQGEVQTAQFKELSASLREARDAKFKG